MDTLAIGIDIGTTFSSSSYSFCQGKKSSNALIYAVNRFPRNFARGAPSDSWRIPTQVLYSQSGGVLGFGPEVAIRQADRSDEAGRNGYKAEWFKLHIRPDSLPISEEKNIPPLPPNKTAEAVYSDFLRYLHKSTIEYIRQNSYEASLLDQVGKNVHFIITHPNGWEWEQQTCIRNAAVKAGLIDGESQDHLQLLTEGEAAIHFCIDQGNLGGHFKNLSPKEGLLVIDAGGGTIDLSAYKRVTQRGETDLIVNFKEIVVARCLMQGSTFITLRFDNWLRNALKDTKHDKEFKRSGLYEAISKAFDTSNKLSFYGVGDWAWFDIIRDPTLQDDTIHPHNDIVILDGGIGISGQVIAGFFQESLDAIVDAIEAMKTESESGNQSDDSESCPIKHALLVGGFAENVWFANQLQARLQPLGIQMSIPHTPSSHQLRKAVADGAVSYFLNNHVKTRVAPKTYGVRCYVDYDGSKDEHKKRQYTKDYHIDSASGRYVLEGVFCPIILKGTQVQVGNNVVHSHSFFRTFKDFNPDHFANPLMDPILCYRGDTTFKKGDDVFIDLESDKYDPVFTLESTLDRGLLEDLKKGLRKTFRRYGKSGRKKAWYHFPYFIDFTLGTTELTVRGRTFYNASKRDENITGTLRFNVEKHFEPKSFFFPTNTTANDMETHVSDSDDDAMYVD